MRQTRFITESAIIASIYVVLTLFSNIFGLSNGFIQVRLSECLAILPFFYPSAILGLTLGCLLANIVTGALLYDVVFGTLATLFGAYTTYLIGQKLKNKNYLRWLLPIPNIFFNTLIIPPILAYVYNFNGGLLFFTFTIFIGEFVSSYVLGQLLYLSLSKNKNDL